MGAGDAPASGGGFVMPRTAHIGGGAPGGEGTLGTLVVGLALVARVNKGIVAIYHAVMAKCCTVCRSTEKRLGPDSD